MSATTTMAPQITSTPTAVSERRRQHVLDLDDFSRDEIVEVLERTMPLTPGDNSDCSRRPDQGEAFDLRGGGSIEIQDGKRGRVRFRAEKEVRPHYPQQPWTDPGNPVQVRQRTERTIAVPVRHDSLGQGQPDPGQPGQLQGGGAVRVDLFPRAERTMRRLGRFGLRTRGTTRRRAQ